VDNSELYLKAMLAMLARQSFPPKELAALVGKERQIQAYNLCDGTRTQAEVVKALGLDAGNFSRTAARWAELGILIRVTHEKEIRPVHLYPLPVAKTGEGKKGEGATPSA
jgi:DNA-binding MarR family transcriptional regulator